MRYQDLGVYAYAGPNWARDKEVLRVNFPDEDWFDYVDTA